MKKRMNMFVNLKMSQQIIKDFHIYHYLLDNKHRIKFNSYNIHIYCKVKALIREIISHKISQINKFDGCRL